MIRCTFKPKRKDKRSVDFLHLSSGESGDAGADLCLGDSLKMIQINRARFWQVVGCS